MAPASNIPRQIPPVPNLHPPATFGLTPGPSQWALIVAAIPLVQPLRRPLLLAPDKVYDFQDHHQLLDLILRPHLDMQLQLPAFQCQISTPLGNNLNTTHFKNNTPKITRYFTPKSSRKWLLAMEPTGFADWWSRKLTGLVKNATVDRNSSSLATRSCEGPVGRIHWQLDRVPSPGQLLVQVLQHWWNTWRNQHWRSPSSTSSKWIWRYCPWWCRGPRGWHLGDSPYGRCAGSKSGTPTGHHSLQCVDRGSWIQCPDPWEASDPSGRPIGYPGKTVHRSGTFAYGQPPCYHSNWVGSKCSTWWLWGRLGHVWLNHVPLRSCGLANFANTNSFIALHLLVSGLLITRSEPSWPYQSSFTLQLCIFRKKPCGSRACVWNIWTDVKLLPDDVAFCCSFGFRFSLRDTLSTSTAGFNFNIHFRAGGSGRSSGTATNEDTHLIWWYRLGRQSAYLHHFSFLVNGNRLSPEPACRFCKFHNFRTVVAICQLISSSMDFGDSFFSFILGSFHQPIPVRYNWSVFARKMHSTSEFAKIVLSKCVCVCVSSE